MTVAISITESAMLTALRAWILSLISCEVVQGQGNQVSQPLGGYICITPGTQKRLSTNIDTYTPSGDTQQSTQHVMQGVQVDVYGPDSGTWAAILATVWPDDSTFNFLNEQGGGCRPLLCSDPMQMPLIDGEQQYEERWIIKVFLQYNATVSLNQLFFESVNLGLIDVDATIH